ncbi:MAG: cupin domain-containing protein [Cyanobacteria bacterium J06633_2]
MALTHISAGKGNWIDFGAEDVDLQFTTFGRSNSYTPMKCGFYHFKASNSIDFDYQYDEFKYIVEGEMMLDVRGDRVYHVKQGDCLLIDKGTFIRYSTSSECVMYYVSQASD